MGRHFLNWCLVLLFIASAVSGCVKTWPDNQTWKPTGQASQATTEPGAIAPAATPTPPMPSYLATRDPALPLYTPTPDRPHPLPTPRTEKEQYTIRSGDSLGAIAQRYGVNISAIIQENEIANPDLLEVGKVLTIPAQDPLPPGPDFKIIPDSELVNGPAVANFDTGKIVDQFGGFLKYYRDEVEGTSLSGSEVVSRVAMQYSVNPRLLLALLEYQSRWVTQSTPATSNQDYPMGYLNTGYKGLYLQLSWAANNLNRGFYLWDAGGLSSLILADGVMIPPANTLNAGTVALQLFFSLLDDQAAWRQAVSVEGFSATYRSMFGYPFDFAVEPLLPDGLKQPPMQLPFEPGVDWSFTGGPHGGWGSGSAWAALDFAPPGDALGCVISDAWVVASADGLIVRSQNGEVVEDLDGDGDDQTGWSILYMHIDSNARIKVGTSVKTGERIGHPSCEGGYSTGTHVHLARRYNGEWISADASIPFNLEGWVSSGNGIEYDGWLNKDGKTIEAWNGRQTENQIHR